MRSLALVSDGAHTLSDALAAYVARAAETFEGGADDSRWPLGRGRTEAVGARAPNMAFEIRGRRGGSRHRRGASAWIFREAKRPERTKTDGRRHGREEELAG